MGADLSELSMDDIFRMEVEAHLEALSSGLLALERNPADTSNVETMMRAAHSIKGAARIVGATAVVALAHEMEDCFVAAGAGKLLLSAAAVDVLLRGVDLLPALAQGAISPELQSQVDSVVAALKALASLPTAIPAAKQGPDIAPVPPTPPQEVSPLELPEILDLAAAESFRAELAGTQPLHGGRWRIDAARCRQVDPAGLCLLASLPSWLEPEASIELAGASEGLKRVLKCVGLEGHYRAISPTNSVR